MEKSTSWNTGPRNQVNRAGAEDSGVARIVKGASLFILQTGAALPDRLRETGAAIIPEKAMMPDRSDQNVPENTAQGGEGYIVREMVIRERQGLATMHNHF